MHDDDFKTLIDRGDVDAMERALRADPRLATATVHWFLNRPNESDPLHYVSDAVFNRWLTNGSERRIADLLIEHGAAIDGTDGRESPLIGAISLGVDSVAMRLIDAGAKLESTSVFGARALHWAAWMGADSIVQQLIERGAKLEPRCSEFGATPLFWAVHGYGPDGAKNDRAQVAAAKRLIDAGARIDVRNKQGTSARELAKTFARQDMYALLNAAA